MTAVDAALVAAGVGLPPAWREAEPHRDHDDEPSGWITTETDPYAGDGTHCEADGVPYLLDLSDHQTRAGVLRQLAMWAGDDGEAQAYWLGLGAEGWMLMCDACVLVRDFADIAPIDSPIIPPTAETLARIVEHIGRDHRIRRKLGEEPAKGTLAQFGLMQPHEQWWRFDAREHGGAFIEWDREGKFIGSAGCGKLAPLRLPLADVTDPADALVALVALQS